MKITFDKEADMAYVHIGEPKHGAIIRTEEIAGALVDLDIEGKVVGIEFFNPLSKGLQVDAVIDKYATEENVFDWYMLRMLSMIEFEIK